MEGKLICDFGHLRKVKYGEGLYIGYRWYTSKALMPLYPFGYGLSYTTFELSNISVNNNNKTSLIKRGNLEIKNLFSKLGIFLIG